MNNQKRPMEFYKTTCCAMMIASLQDYHSFDEIKGQIEFFKQDSNQKWHPSDRSGGERNIMVIVSPGENNLEKNLQRLGFQMLTDKMPRRKGYPEGLLKMYMLSW